MSGTARQLLELRNRVTFVTVLFECFGQVLHYYCLQTDAQHATQPKTFFYSQQDVQQWSYHAVTTTDIAEHMEHTYRETTQLTTACH